MEVFCYFRAKSNVFKLAFLPAKTLWAPTVVLAPQSLVVEESLSISPWQDRCTVAPVIHRCEAKVSLDTTLTLLVSCCALSKSACLLVALLQVPDFKTQKELMSTHVDMPLKHLWVALGHLSPVQRKPGNGKREAQDLKLLHSSLSSPDLIVNIIVRFKREHKECICLELLITSKLRLTRRYEQL